MAIKPEKIAAILRNEDIEGLIALGAPADEYDSEAEKIAKTIAGWPAGELTQANISALIALLWAKSFNRTAQEIEQRMPAFMHISKNILASVGL
jgi:hypothetical protein